VELLIWVKATRFAMRLPFRHYIKSKRGSRLGRQDRNPNNYRCRGYLQASNSAGCPKSKAPSSSLWRPFVWRRFTATSARLGSLATQPHRKLKYSSVWMACLAGKRSLQKNSWLLLTTKRWCFPW
jgi:hypothetical protein